MHVSLLIFNIKSHQAEKTNYAFVFVKDILHATLDQHWHEYLVRGKFLQQIDIAWQKFILDFIVRNVREVMNDPILGEQLRSSWSPLSPEGLLACFINQLLIKVFLLK